MIGKTLGNYRVTGTLGKGGMGEVYLAEDSRLDRTVALKILPPEVAGDPQRRVRFEREARLAAALKHPSVAHIYDVGEQDGVWFIAMEHVEGCSLAEEYKGRKWEIEHVLKVGIQVAEALADAADKGIVHRDIKPGNIMITTGGQVKVLDFGLAKRGLQPDEPTDSTQNPTVSHLTQAGAVLGTVPYMSPEQALGKSVDTRSDLFSLGVVLYQMVSGMRPFTGDTPTEIITRIAHEPAPPLKPDRSRIPAELSRIIGKCLEKDPGARYQTARELAVDLKNLRRDASSSSIQSLGGPRERSRMRWPLAAAGLVVIALLVAGVFYFLPGTPDPSIRAIAVLPFLNGTGDPEADYLCDGVAEGVINALAQAPGLKVISRASAFAFRNENDIQEVSRRLGVDAVVMGRMVKSGDELTVSAELVDTREDRQLWGGRYSRSMDEVMRLEAELAGTIARTLQVALPGKSSDRSGGTTENPQAYQLFLKGTQFLVGSRTEMDRATQYLKQAVEEDPGYTLAWATLAESYVRHAAYGTMDKEEALGKARAAIRRALELDPDSAEAYAVAGDMATTFEWDWEKAETDLRKAVRLSPGSSFAYVRYAEYLTVMGRLDEALEVSSKAQALDPHSSSPAHWVAIDLLLMGRYDEAEQQFARAVENNPTWTWGYIKRAVTLASAGRAEEALASARLAESSLMGAPTSSARAWLGCVYAMSGRADMAEESLSDLEGMPGANDFDISTLTLCLDDMPRTLDLLESAHESRYPGMIYLKAFPTLFGPELRDEPRYQALLEKMRLN